MPIPFAKRFEPRGTKKPRSVLRTLKNWIVSFAVAFADWNDVPTGSMEPTILPGDRILVNKLAYGLRVPFTHTWLARWDDPSAGEIVIFASPKDGTRLVKRVIAGPGDTIELRNNVLVINGVAQAYSPLTESSLETLSERFKAGRAF